jgi:hypothetical protein
MTQKALNVTNVGPTLQEMRSIRVPKRVNTPLLRDAGSPLFALGRMVWAVRVESGPRYSFSKSFLLLLKFYSAMCGGGSNNQTGF